MWIPTTVKEHAELSCFYVTEDQKMLRIDHCHEAHFECHDEDTGNDFRIEYTEVNLSTSHFLRLMRIT